jgi:hypothetical protein
MHSSTRIVIDSRFHGPPDSGNGGYVCGRLAQYIEGDAEVRLRLPPPLQRELQAQHHDNGSVLLCDGDKAVAEAHAATLDLHPPAPPSYATAEAARKAYKGFQRHVFPTCFVCGPQRDPGDGLRIFAGSVTGANMVAAPWIPHASLTDTTGRVRPEFVWAALDCAGGFAVDPAEGKAIVLGLLTAHVPSELRADERCIVVGWRMGSEGRKHFAGTAVFSESGHLHGKAKATWIEIENPSSS